MSIIYFYSSLYFYISLYIYVSHSHLFTLPFTCVIFLCFFLILFIVFPCLSCSTCLIIWPCSEEHGRPYKEINDKVLELWFSDCIIISFLPSSLSLSLSVSLSLSLSISLSLSAPDIVKAQAQAPEAKANLPIPPNPAQVLPNPIEPRHGRDPAPAEHPRHRQSECLGEGWGGGSFGKGFNGLCVTWCNVPLWEVSRTALFDLVLFDFILWLVFLSSDLAAYGLIFTWSGDLLWAREMGGVLSGICGSRRIGRTWAFGCTVDQDGSLNGNTFLWGYSKYVV